MSLYPSLEDMKVDQLARAQAEFAGQVSNMHRSMSTNNSPSAPYSTGTGSLSYPTSPVDANFDSNDLSILYPALNEYMGIEFTQEILAANMPEYLTSAEHQHGNMSTVPYNSASSIIAPISGSSIGFRRAQVTHGIRQLTLCKGSDGKIGLRVKDINKGVFVSLVKKASPAALSGLRFGDQILQINGKNLAGMAMESVHDLLRKAPANGIQVAVRDRPFERTITLHKDSGNHIGFQFKDSEIIALVKDSSAARNGLLTNHHLLEVNGQNVVGLKDKEITDVINECGQVVTVTVMPSYLYKHMVKNMASSLVTKLMDHSIPDF